MKKGIGLFTLIIFLSISFISYAQWGGFSLKKYQENQNADIEEAQEAVNQQMRELERDMDSRMAPPPPGDPGNASDGLIQLDDGGETTIDDSSSDEPSFLENTTRVIKEKFYEGGVGFMSVVLICLIFGLALVIERIVYLNLATTNSKKLLSNVEGALNSGGVKGLKAAKEVCRNTRGPIASIFYQGLDRSSEGIEQVEKSIVAYGGVQMGLLEKGLSWISLCIALAPMLGFMGTVIGMIDAFDSIQAAGDISPSLVAGGIKIALLTTVFGLIVAIILQMFYNYLISKVDSIVNDMEDASISLVDLLVSKKVVK